jgi:hypothetical protein
MCVFQSFVQTSNQLLLRKYEFVPAIRLTVCKDQDLGGYRNLKLNSETFTFVKIDQRLC